MKKTILSILIILALVPASHLTAQSLMDLLAEKKLALRIGENFLKLCPDSIIYKDEAKSRKWNYEQGLMLGALHQLYKVYGEKKFFNYVQQNLDYYVQEDGTIKTYQLTEYNIDNIPPGRMLLMLNKETGLQKYRIAADWLRKQLETHPRTPEGGYWHKKIYPNQMWLDGLYMGQPFYAKYSVLVKDSAAFDDIMKHFRLSYYNTRDEKSGLLYHAWDASKKEAWADKQTGKSPNFWGRAIGWYMMALVDVLDYFPKNHEGRKELIAMLQSNAEAIMKVRDSESKLWYQILDKKDSAGNYLEASASNMFVYAFAKGANKGYLDKKYYAYAMESYKAILSRLVSVTEDGTINLLDVCRVSGLGGKPYRDGSLAYYFSEPKRTNDFKGYGPFLFAAVELERGITLSDKKSIGLDYYYNNEYKNGVQYHYTWEDTAFSGFSEVGKVFNQLGEQTIAIKQAPDLSVLKNLKLYIIVDPDTPKETENPNYLMDAEISALEQWVKEGGKLMLFANDSGNCEFTHLNKLANRFGIHFNYDSDNRVTGKNFDMGKFDSLPNHPVFSGVQQLYLKEISSIKLSDYAEAILKRGNNTYMAVSRYGKGLVFAVGDPWLYNEYFDNRKLPVPFDNYKAAINLFTWFLQQ